MIQFHAVVRMRQAFSEGGKSKSPWTWLTQHVLEICSQAWHLAATAPSLTHAAALESITPYKVRMLVLDIPEARHVNTVRAIANLCAVFVAGHDSGRAAAHDVVHQVTPQLST